MLVSFTPTAIGSVSGSLTIADNAGTQTVSLTGTGSASVTLSSSTLSFGTLAVGNTYGSGIAAGANCTVGVTFIPTSATSFTGTLTFTDSAANSPQTVSLTGTGSAPVTLSSSTLNLGTVTVGGTSEARTVRLTNHQSVSLSFSSIVASTRFTVASNTCGSSIAAGASCTVGVTFSPTATGAATGTLTFTDNAPNSPQTVSLSGTGR